MKHALEAGSDRVIWMRVLDLDNKVLAEGGKPQGIAKLPPRWWTRVEKHESLGSLTNTPEGKALTIMLPLRLRRASHAEDRRPPYVLELAISLKAVGSAFEGLRENLVVGLIASIGLLVSVAVIGLRAPHYFRGKYLESEMQMAKRVQSDLRPGADSVSPHVNFAASTIAADHVGGDFYDIFEAERDKFVIVLGDASGKGVPAALLVSVLHGAIRSSAAWRHELACERINRMLCERTACERFATLFWGVYDSKTRRLTYVNAGHAAPMLIRRNGNRIERLDEGGPVLGLLPGATYSAGTVDIDDADTLILYSDGISEATNQNEQEFGESRIEEAILNSPDAEPQEICQRILNQLAAFANTGTTLDDRTLMALKFSQSAPALRDAPSEGAGMAAVA